MESRLALIDKLKRKYGSGIEEILRYFEEVKANLAAAETSGERRKQLRKEIAGLRAGCEEAAARLSGRRRDAARKLEKRVEAELDALAMGRTTFRVSLAPSEWSEDGADAVLFLISANLGEEPRPLDRIVSGGELSRLALALKTSISGAGGRTVRAGVPRTLVFDEVDAGIGGSTAETVGRRLRGLASGNQVLCVTHLPQIASLGQHHFRVEKLERDGRTVSTVEELSARARVEEIGRMISGQTLTREALKHAEQLLKAGAVL